MAGKGLPSCDWRGRGTLPVDDRRTREKGSVKRKDRVTPPAAAAFMRHKDFSWSGVRTERYKRYDGTWTSVLRRVIIGNRGEKTKFHVRYFEVGPGGHTTLERHRHEHVVIGVRGKGECLVGRKKFGIAFLDALYIPPGAPHRLGNPHVEPFGFFCIVDAGRDRPRPIRARHG